MDIRLAPMTFQLVEAGTLHRPAGFDSGWRSLGTSLLTRVRGGTYVVETPEHGIRLGDRMGFIVPGGLRHRVRVDGDAPVITSYTNLRCRVFEQYDVFASLDRPVAFGPEEGEEIAAAHAILLDARAGEASLAASVRTAAAVARLVQVVVDRTGIRAGAWASPAMTWILPVLRYVRDHLGEPLDRAVLARVAGVSVSRLHARFIAALGVAPMHWIRTERMLLARQLLQFSTLPVREIARQCGFGDPYHFSRAFRADEGVAPSRYRATVESSR